MSINLKLTGDWKKGLRILNGLSGRVDRAYKKAILAEAHFLRKAVIKAFSEEGYAGRKWQPHSAATKAIRALLGNNKSKLLIQSGDMRNSIGVVPFEGGVFVGVKRSAKSKSKLGPVNLALVHEQGANIVVHLTDKQRKLLFAAYRAAGISRSTAKRPKGSAGGATIIHIHIPPRPFLSPVFEDLARPEPMTVSILSRMSVFLEGDIGTAPGRPRE